MTPGLAGGPPFSKKATKNAVVAIASIEKPSVPTVVGVCEIDIGSLTQVQGAKGHAVRSEHWDGDELWAWSSNARSGAAAPEQIHGWMSQDAITGLSQRVETLKMEAEEDDDDSGGVSVDSKQEQPQPRKLELQGEDVASENFEPFERVEEKEFSTKGKLAPIEESNRKLSLQISTMHFGRRSFMLYTIVERLTEMRRTMAFLFPFLSPL